MRRFSHSHRVKHDHPLSILRSAPMSYVGIVMTDDASYATLKALGEWGWLMPEAVNLPHPSHPVKHFRHETAVIDERVQSIKRQIAKIAYWERKIEAIVTACQQYGIELVEKDDVEIIEQSGKVLEEIASYLDPLDANLTGDMVFEAQQKSMFVGFTHQLILCQFAAYTGPIDSFRAQTTFSRGRGNAGREQYGSFASENTSLLSDTDTEIRGIHGDLSEEANDSETSHLTSYLASAIYGVVPSEKLNAMERMIFRVSRGNAILKSKQVEIINEFDRAMDNERPSPKSYALFRVIVVGDQLVKRMEKILSYFGATVYQIPRATRENLRLQRELEQRITDCRKVLLRTEAAIVDQLTAFSYDESTGSSPYHNWSDALQKEKLILDVLLRCHRETPTSRMLHLEGWVPTEQLEHLSSILHAAVRRTQLQQGVLQILRSDTSSSFPSNPSPNSSSIMTSPPSYFPTNKFTSSFQSIVDTYGIARYGEINPALFTVISFPFLFGVMYGDIFHGTMLTLGSIFLILRERSYEASAKRKQLNEIVEMVFSGRYLLLLMGIFAIYCGFIYNDAASLPVSLFQSGWELNSSHDENIWTGHVYPFGVDHRWYHSKNELAFFNSLKMKASILLGVSQMTFGILLSAWNAATKNSRIVLWAECLPRLLFMLCTFGYMSFIIVYKWCQDWSTSSKQPPNLIQTMIAMFLSPGNVPEQQQLYPGQGPLQFLLVVIALLMVPIMLFVPPILEHKHKSAAHNHASELVPSSSIPIPSPDVPENDEESQIQKPKKKSKSRIKSSLEKVRSYLPSFQKKSHRGNYQMVSEAAGSDDEASSDDAIEEETRSLHSGRTRTRKPLISQGTSLSDSESGNESGSDNEIDQTESTSTQHTQKAHETESLSDALITSGIHTIEFVLGCVSNTASYLRLWALSLAHAQLASVFFTRMILQYGIINSPVQAFMGIAVWCCATASVLLAMDVLECFLHALRLHWVEFQNKFYAADGRSFEPFSFTRAASDAT